MIRAKNTLVDHQMKALLRGWELRDVVTGMGASDVFLHGAKAFFLEISILSLASSR